MRLPASDLLAGLGMSACKGIAQPAVTLCEALRLANQLRRQLGRADSLVGKARADRLVRVVDGEESEALQTEVAAAPPAEHGAQRGGVKGVALDAQVAQ